MISAKSESVQRVLLKIVVFMIFGTHLHVVTDMMDARTVTKFAPNVTLIGRVQNVPPLGTLKAQFAKLVPAVTPVQMVLGRAV
jgi:hypothetical protein